MLASPRMYMLLRLWLRSLLLLYSIHFLGADPSVFYTRRIARAQPLWRSHFGAATYRFSALLSLAPIMLITKNSTVLTFSGAKD